MLPKIPNEEISRLTYPPNQSEIKTTLWNIHPYKTPGEDGLHAIFYQKSWDITKDQISKGIDDIFTNWKIPNTWCKTFLCLIPKIENPTTLNHFCPLCLCTTQYKILAKILVNRLRLHLQKLISTLQELL